MLGYAARIQPKELLVDALLITEVYTESGVHPGRARLADIRWRHVPLEPRTEQHGRGFFEIASHSGKELQLSRPIPDHLMSAVRLIFGRSRGPFGFYDTMDQIPYHDLYSAVFSNREAIVRACDAYCLDVIRVEEAAREVAAVLSDIAERNRSCLIQLSRRWVPVTVPANTSAT